jgi:hypothetical protein
MLGLIIALLPERPESWNDRKAERPGKPDRRKVTEKNRFQQEIKN